MAVPLILLVIIGLALAGPNLLESVTPVLIIGLIGFCIAGITLLIFTISPGTTGPNRYGPDPYGPDNLEEVFA